MYSFCDWSATAGYSVSVVQTIYKCTIFTNRFPLLLSVQAQRPTYSLTGPARCQGQWPQASAILPDTRPTDWISGTPNTDHWQSGHLLRNHRHYLPEKHIKPTPQKEGLQPQSVGIISQAVLMLSSSKSNILSHPFAETLLSRAPRRLQPCGWSGPGTPTPLYASWINSVIQWDSLTLL